MNGVQVSGAFEKSPLIQNSENSPIWRGGTLSIAGEKQRSVTALSAYGGYEARVFIWSQPESRGYRQAEESAHRLLSCAVKAAACLRHHGWRYRVVTKTLTATDFHGGGERPANEELSVEGRLSKRDYCPGRLVLSW